MKSIVILFVCLAVSSALPIEDTVVLKLDPNIRYHYIKGGDGTVHLVDLWLKTSDVREAARYNPDTENIYHLFTRNNPSVSQPILTGYTELLSNSNFDANKPIVVIVSGWLSDATSSLSVELVPAFLAAGDFNVIVVDWSAGNGNINYIAALFNTITSGESVARFITWLNNQTGSTLSQVTLVGFSLGGHQVGIIGRNLGGQVAYIVSLDPAGPGWDNIVSNHRFRPDDGLYTEVIHSNVGVQGFLDPLGLVDFYPNGGVNMPGCGISFCDHDRAFFYFSESIRTGGFTGTKCSDLEEALAGTCSLPETLQMGGLQPKSGNAGVYHVHTNAQQPFSLG